MITRHLLTSASRSNSPNDAAHNGAMARKAAGLSYRRNQLLTYFSSLNRLDHKQFDPSYGTVTIDKRNSYAMIIGLVATLLLCVR
jgi:hypothetical protein